MPKTLNVSTCWQFVDLPRFTIFLRRKGEENLCILPRKVLWISAFLKSTFHIILMKKKIIWKLNICFVCSEHRQREFLQEIDEVFEQRKWIFTFHASHSAEKGAFTSVSELSFSKAEQLKKCSHYFCTWNFFISLLLRFQLSDCKKSFWQKSRSHLLILVDHSCHYKQCWGNCGAKSTHLCLFFPHWTKLNAICVQMALGDLQCRGGGLGHPANLPYVYTVLAQMAFGGHMGGRGGGSVTQFLSEPQNGCPAITARCFAQWRAELKSVRMCLNISWL